MLLCFWFTTNRFLLETLFGLGQDQARIFYSVWFECVETYSNIIQGFYLYTLKSVSNFTINILLIYVSIILDLLLHEI